MTPTELDLDVLLNRLESLLCKLDPGGPRPQATEKTLIYDIASDSMRPITQEELDLMDLTLRCQWTFQAIMARARLWPTRVEEVFKALRDLERTLGTGRSDNLA